MPHICVDMYSRISDSNMLAFSVWGHARIAHSPQLQLSRMPQAPKACQ